MTVDERLRLVIKNTEEVILEDLSYDGREDWDLSSGIYDIWLGIDSWEEFNGETTEYEWSIARRTTKQLMISARGC